jgi:hypothetical protein
MVQLMLFREIIAAYGKIDIQHNIYCVDYSFSTAGPRPGTGPREAWGNYNMLQDFISPVDN